MKPLVWLCAPRPSGITRRVDRAELIETVRADGLVIPIDPTMAPRWPVSANPDEICETSRALMLRCDAVLVVAPVEDRQPEIETARHAGIPIFDSRVRLNEWAVGLNGGARGTRLPQLVEDAVTALTRIRLERPHITGPGRTHVLMALDSLHHAEQLLGGQP